MPILFLKLLESVSFLGTNISTSLAMSEPSQHQFYFIIQLIVQNLVGLAVALSQEESDFKTDWFYILDTSSKFDLQVA